MQQFLFISASPGNSAPSDEGAVSGGAGDWGRENL